MPINPMIAPNMLDTVRNATRSMPTARNMDPRAAAIEQYMMQQGQGSQMPVIPPDQHMTRSMNQNPNAIIDDQGMDGDEEEAAIAAMDQKAPWEGQEPDHDDEEMLEKVQQGARGEREPPEDMDEWPATAKEFEKLYGRPPSTDTEVEFYADEAEANTPWALRRYDNSGFAGQDARRPNMPPSRRFQNTRESEEDRIFRERDEDTRGRR